MDDKYTNETINAINKEKMKKQDIIAMNNYVKAEEQRLQMKQIRISADLKKRAIKQGIAALLIATGIGTIGAHMIHEKIDVLDYSSSAPKQAEELSEEAEKRMSEYDKIGNIEQEENYNDFLEYNAELKEKYPDAPEAYTAPTEENYKLFLEEQEKNKGGR